MDYRGRGRGHGRERGGRGTPLPAAAGRLGQGTGMQLPVMVPTNPDRTIGIGERRLQLKLVGLICDNRPEASASLAGIQGVAITATKSDGISNQEAGTFDGVMLCKLDASGPKEVECTVLMLKQEGDAKSMFESSTSVAHNRIAKAHFFAYSEVLNTYIVCFEHLELFPTASSNKGTMHDASNQTHKYLNSWWLASIREIFEALGALHKVGHGHGQLNKVSSFVYAAPMDKLGRKTLKIFRADVRRMISDKEEHVQFLKFLEMCGASDLMDYPSFKELVENGLSLKEILNHPFLLKSAEERVSSISETNEKLFDLDPYKLQVVDAMLQKSLQKSLNGTSWKTVVNNNKAKFGNFVLNSQITKTKCMI